MYHPKYGRVVFDHLKQSDPTQALVCEARHDKYGNNRCLFVAVDDLFTKALAPAAAALSSDALLSALDTHAELVLELGTNSEARINCEYRQHAGESVPEANSKSVFLIASDPNHAEYRVIIPADFPIPVGYSYQTVWSRRAGWLTINCKDLFYIMVDRGMRLREYVTNRKLYGSAFPMLAAMQQEAQ